MLIFTEESVHKPEDVGLSAHLKLLFYQEAGALAALKTCLQSSRIKTPFLCRDETTVVFRDVLLTETCVWAFASKSSVSERTLRRCSSQDFTWVSRGKGCSLPLAGRSSVLWASDSWSPPPSARPRSRPSPHSAGPPVRITPTNISLPSPPNLFQFVGTSSDISSRFIFVHVSYVCVAVLFKCYKPHPASERQN